MYVYHYSKTEQEFCIHLFSPCVIFAKGFNLRLFQIYSYAVVVKKGNNFQFPIKILI